MTGGSQQLRRFRIAMRDGATVEDAAALAGIGVAEAQMHAADDARDPPPAEAYRPLSRAFCSRCARIVCGCSDAQWTGLAA